MSIADLERRLAALESTVRGMIRVGKVVTRAASNGTVRVQLPDLDNLVSGNIPVMFPKTRKDKIFHLPDIGEQVICVFLGNGLEAGYCLGAIYSDIDPVPTPSGDVWEMRFSDGTDLKYNRAAHVLTADVQGAVSVTATGPVSVQADGQVSASSEAGMVLDAPAVSIKTDALTVTSRTGGAMAASLSGTFAVTEGDVIAEGVSLRHHIHGGVVRGNDETDEPVGGGGGGL